MPIPPHVNCVATLPCFMSAYDKRCISKGLYITGTDCTFKLGSIATLECMLLVGSVTFVIASKIMVIIDHL